MPLADVAAHGAALGRSARAGLVAGARALRDRTVDGARALLADRPLLALLLLALALRLLALATHPFYVEGDGGMYHRMALESRSNLLHAGGHAFLAAPLRPLAALLGLELAVALRFAQAALGVATLGVLFTSLRALPDVRPAAAWLVAAVLAADPLLLAAGSTARPEFLQAMLTLLTLSLVARALVAPPGAVRSRWLVATGAAAAATYLVKYNSVVLALALLVPLSEPGAPWRQRLRAAGALGAGALVYAAVFLAAFHAPTTRTLHLNLEHGWIHLEKLKAAGIPVDPAHGVATRRLLVAARALPPTDVSATLWAKLRMVPEAERAAWRARLAPALASLDPAFLDAELARLPDPGDVRTPDVFCRLYHHLGLREAEALIWSALLEALRAQPGAYARHVGDELLVGATARGAYEPYLPFPGLAGRAADDGPSRPCAPGAVLVVNEERLDPAPVRRATWWPGAALLGRLALFPRLPPWVPWLAALIGLPFVAASLVRGRALSELDRLYLLSLGLWLGLLAFAALVFVFRAKELIVALPLAVLTAGLSLSRALAPRPAAPGPAAPAA